MYEGKDILQKYITKGLLGIERLKISYADSAFVIHYESNGI